MRLGLSLAIAASCAVVASPAVANDAAHPTVVELYQSQGCSSCPPAIANLNRLAGRRDVLALMFAVTYWDALGWKDTFARPEFTQRQRDFANAGGRSEVSTPQVIVNGRQIANGGDAPQLVAAIRAADRGTTGPAISARPGKAIIGRGEARRTATIWLVRFDPRPLRVPIRAGENGGRTLTHTDIVRSLTAVGTWRGSETVVTLPAGPDPELRSAILVQSGRGGPIVAAAKL